jgi:CBS domain-containing protein
MNVAKVMTRKVITVAPRTPLKEVAQTMVEKRISGMPVVDEDGTVLGVVSEADILEKERARANGNMVSRLLELGDSVKHDARDAADAMTAPPITIRPQRSISEAASLMLERRINRLPVVDDHNRLVGIVTRADLVRVFVRPDAQIEEEIRSDVILKTLWNAPDRFHVDVTSGEVTIEGEVHDAESAALLVRFVERVPGVVTVRSRITWPTAL